jgi:hypothetical protein
MRKAVIGVYARRWLMKMAGDKQASINLRLLKLKKPPASQLAAFSCASIYTQVPQQCWRFVQLVSLPKATGQTITFTDRSLRHLYG